MNHYLLPTNREFLEEIAKAIVKNRIAVESERYMIEEMGLHPDPEKIAEALDLSSNDIWVDDSVNGESNREMYLADAHAVISAINLKIMLWDNKMDK